MKRNLQTVPALAADSPFTENQLRWWIFNETENGLANAGAVVRVGRRVYVDTNRFEHWIETQNKARTNRG